MTTLLHTCCGPCASACVPTLKGLGRVVTMLFANSNIDTREEFEKRLCEARKLAAADGVEIAALPYDHEDWYREVAAGYEHEPEKGARCVRCFRYNLAKAAEYAKANGFGEFTTSLTVSPHKASQTVFDIGNSLCDPLVRFLACDFKKRDGFRLSTRRTKELGLYRQNYCGCEFSRWRIHHKPETSSTNLDARVGRHGDVFTADYQTAGRGRLDHKWFSSFGTNLMMSVVLSVADLAPDRVATLPLVVGLAVVKSLTDPASPVRMPDGADVSLKWPNDVLVGGGKVAGILCERHGGNVIVGIGLNVSQRTWPGELQGRATSLAQETGREWKVCRVRNAVLGQLARWCWLWREKGFAAAYPEIAAVDWLKGREISVHQTDADAAPLSGVCGGIQPDGSLDIDGVKAYAGEVHVGVMV